MFYSWFFLLLFFSSLIHMTNLTVLAANTGGFLFNYYILCVFFQWKSFWQEKKLGVFCLKYLFRRKHQHFFAMILKIFSKCFSNRKFCVFFFCYINSHLKKTRACLLCITWYTATKKVFFSCGSDININLAHDHIQKKYIYMY